MKRSEEQPGSPKSTPPVPSAFTPAAHVDDPAHAGGMIAGSNWRVVHRRVPFTERERALARRLGISLQGALSVTSLIDICRIGLTVEDPQFRADCKELIEALDSL
mgnify:CR=1 FL=1